MKNVARYDNNVDCYVLFAYILVTQEWKIREKSETGNSASSDKIFCIFQSILPFTKSANI